MSDPPVASQAPSATAEAFDPVAEAPECATAFTPDAYTDFDSSGLKLREYQGWRTDSQFMSDDDGIACAWQGSGDAVVVFGQLALAAAEWESKMAELLTAGFLEETAPVRGANTVSS
ncbi:hypothetical protein E3T35_14095 [Cryobacterium sp. TMT1-2-2]|nr:hypothetical protein [Cryobacterium sp. TMT1-2-2]TFD09617.1 hypothetical protein E3T35_14095 [Cryobacterium sp. TMT1-2-2]